MRDLNELKKLGFAPSYGIGFIPIAILSPIDCKIPLTSEEFNLLSRTHRHDWDALDKKEPIVININNLFGELKINGSFNAEDMEQLTKAVSSALKNALEK